MMLNIVDESKKRKLADQKRLEGLQQLKDQKQAQSRLVSTALNSGQSSKRIVFDASYSTASSSAVANEAASTSKRKTLFEEDDEADDDNFTKKLEEKVNRSIKSKKTDKLIELQSRFATDDRFRVDENFVDSEDDDDNQDVDDERQKNFEILESVLGKPVKASPNKRTTLDSDRIVRYDPDAPDIVEKLEIKPVKKKKRADEEKTNAEDEVKKPETSKERFYEISNNLKDMFASASTSGFTFGVSTSNDDRWNVYSAEPLPNARQALKNTKNPFEYDSSDTEDEQPASAGKERAKATDRKVDHLRTASFEYEKFFIAPNDKRLDKDAHFFDPERIKKFHDEQKATTRTVIEVLARKRRHAKRMKQFAEKIAEQQSRKKRKTLQNAKKFNRKKLWKSDKSGKFQGKKPNAVKTPSTKKPNS